MTDFANFKFSPALLCLCLIASSLAPSFARGSYGGHDPQLWKDYRDEHAWNGDSYMSDYEKACTYRNYKMPDGYSVNAAGYVRDNTGRYTNYHNPALWDGISNSATGEASNNTATAVSANYSGPAYIGPANYNCVVQSYTWPTAANGAQISPRHQPLTNSSIDAARKLGH